MNFRVSSRRIFAVAALAVLYVATRSGESVLAGKCDIAIANTYYMGKMMTNEAEPEQKEWANCARIIFPSSADMGTHVNISGMLLAKNAPDKARALKLMKFLASDDGQTLCVEDNFEYPVNPAVPASKIVQDWGSFTPDTLSIAEIAKYQKAAAKQVDEIQFKD